MKVGFGVLAVGLVGTAFLMSQAPQRGMQLVADHVEFVKFISIHGKSYSTKEEFTRRLNRFNEIKTYIDGHNSKEGASYTLGINKYADWSREERRTLEGVVKSKRPAAQSQRQELLLSEIPEQVDWRERGAVNEVVDQGTCNSCWAFATTAAMEGAHFAAHGELKKLSEQMMIDCCFGDDCGGRTQGCHHGGCIHCALQWMQEHPQVSESDYPYLEANSTTNECRREQFSQQASAANVTIVEENSTSQLLAGLVQVPVTVAVDSESDDFMFYKSGIFDSMNCGIDVDHAMLAVGYNLGTNSTGYWIVKNSFGKGWGEEGYIRFAMTPEGDAGICGVQSDASYALAN